MWKRRVYPGARRTPRPGVQGILACAFGKLLIPTVNPIIVFISYSLSSSFAHLWFVAFVFFVPVFLLHVLIVVCGSCSSLTFCVDALLSRLSDISHQCLAFNLLLLIFSYGQSHSFSCSCPCPCSLTSFNINTITRVLINPR